eukprot:maker-scaffold2896_size11495-snap-gene-0.3 protein:Tk10818 transcript:maker-scaffold2896_size11495-snap-gene-0.3-mRNA-1 annotation:"hypothetical protein DAPPUDRAFT_303061"
MKSFLGLILLASLASLSVAKPSSRRGELSDVKFYVYTRQNENSGQDLSHDLSNLGSTNFDASRSKTFLTIHGWNSNLLFTDNFVEDLLKAEDANIIGVDWSLLESWTNYFDAAETSLEVGTYVGEMVSNLMQNHGLSHNNFHAIGHSLGAQAVGHLGRKVSAVTGSKVARITGLDPARPYFEILDAGLRLNKNDAKYVDVIHSNSGSLIDGCLSFMSPMGHVDFYPAGGDHQPGCTEICLGDCTENDIIDLIKGGCSHSRANKYFVESINANKKFNAVKCDSWDEFLSGGDHQPGCTEICLGDCTENDIIDLIKGGCSHSRANKYFVESINANKKFNAVKCDSWDEFLSGGCSGTSNEMGYHSNQGSEGKFYLDVNREPPFAMGG